MLLLSFARTFLSFCLTHVRYRRAYSDFLPKPLEQFVVYAATETDSVWTTKMIFFELHEKEMITTHYEERFAFVFIAGI